MTNPQGPPNDPSTWARPGDQGPPAGFPAPSDQPTTRMRTGDPGAGRAPEPPPTHTQPAQQAEQQTEQLAAANAAQRRSGYQPPPSATGARTTGLATPEEEAGPVKKKRRLRDPLSIILVLVIVFALVLAGLIGAELYVRHKANSKVAEAVACEFQDQATARFGVAPLVLWQVITQHFTNISAETAGNQLRGAKGAKLQFTVQNVQLKDSPNSKGTIGAIDATITWTSEGIKDSVQSAIPVLGAFVSSTVTTHPNDGTVELKGLLNDITAKPVVSGNVLQLRIQTFNALGFSMPRESVESTLNGFISDQMKNLPLGIHFDSVQVTSTGVVSHLSTRNATIPTGGTDTCFANL